MAQTEKHPEITWRKLRRAKDRHGRTYEFTIDVRTNDPVSRIRPLFKAPWHPEGFVRLVHNPEDGTSTVDLQEDAVIADRERALREWEERMFQVGLAMHGDAFNPKSPTAQLLRIVGKKPEPVEYALAAKKDDAWVLGKTTVMPGWAKKLQRETTVVEDKFAFLNEGSEDLDKYGEVEEAFDPLATGGKRVAVGKTVRTR